ncbi:MAG: protein translocase subunit SecF [Candidatus Levyibacteriota bacterium]|nr:MAG: protein translocase subunit SecF [Candidatus Levybacteria bacterium]
MNIVGKKYWYFGLSLLVIIPGFISLFLWGLRLSIDFTGGSRIEFRIQNSKFKIERSEFEKTIKNQGMEISSIQQSKDTFIVRTKPLDQKTHQKVKGAIESKFRDAKEVSFQTVGPTIGKETTLNAIKAIVVASILIVLYIAWSFRKVPKPASSWRFGICAIAALLHDVLVVVGIFSILGHFWHVEVDSLFVTAILTIIGFSVHDTIVVFDRIRENLRRMPGVAFANIVNDSILQTLSRSLNTSITVILVLFTMLLFGGETIRWFIVALLIGIASGTYSSIFNAAPLLVVWQELTERRKQS